MSLSFSLANNWADVPEVQRPVPWAKGPGREHISFRAEVDGSVWELRMNDFPDEPFHTLIIDGEEIIHFDDWPSFWLKPASPDLDRGHRG